MPTSLRSQTLVTAAAVATLLVALVLFRRPAAELVVIVVEWVDGLGWMAPAAFTAIFTATIPLFVPTTPFLLGAGMLFGPLRGTAYGVAGTVLGGAVCFALARHLLREPLRGKLRRHTGFLVLEKALSREGVRGAALIRFSPTLPAWLINYGLGFSRLTWRQYLLSATAVVPTVVLYALAGAGLGDLAALAGGAGPERGIGYHALLVTGILATLAASLLLGRRAKRILETIDDEARG